ncbi:MAG TPA: prolyl oligopeptidase family serine peptidase [Casimicrobiaceae bacterium]|nr:prolyl oligopeptidase family serine peptidase [Casimicrobiaceae bacterium]
MKRTRVAILAASLASFASASFAATFAGVEVPAPPPTKNVTEQHWGVTVDDPYRFFEDVKDPAVQAWMKAQANATESILAKIPGRDALLARIKEIEASASGLTDRAVRAESGRYFYLKRDPADNQFSLVYRDSANAPEKLIVDPEALRKTTGTPHAVLDFAPSPDGKRIAYAMQAGGGEIGTLHVVDLASGKEIIKPIDRIRYASVSWLDDGSGFFYSRLREGYEKMAATERFDDRSRHFHGIAGDTDRKVFSVTHNPELKLPSYASGIVFQIPGTNRVASLVLHGVERNVGLMLADLDAAKAGNARWQSVVTLADKVGTIAIGGGYIYVRTSKGSPRFAVMRMPLASPDLAKAEIVMPASESVITELGAARDGAYAVRRDGATQSLWRIAHRSPKPEKIALPFEGSVDITGTTARRDGIVFSLGGWTRSTKPYVYEPSQAKAMELPFVKKGRYDAPDDIVAREVRYKSHDGVEVPMSIVSRKDVKLDGSNPTILYGYGAYSVTEDPFFNPRNYAWIERGGIYAYAHVRGGGAYGEEWHMAGRKTTKPNTWKDAIAAGEWLIANGYTSKQRLGILGGSAGGIFVGRAITDRPDLFAAAVPAVGVFDGPRFESSANGVANVPEFGTVKNEDEFKGLMAMSTYHAIRDNTPYPGILLVHGVNDSRVDVWQTLKAGARFATATSSGKPVLKRLEYDSGHGQGSTRAQSQARTADIYSFFLWQFGVPEFQPKAGL